MKYLISITKRKPLLFCLSLLFLSSVAFAAIPPAASAQDTAFLKPCRLKVNKSTCEAEVKEECDGKSGRNKNFCASGKALKYATVFKECWKKQNPQSCHAKLKKDCRGKTGNARNNCKKEKAKSFSAATSTDDGGTGSFASAGEGKQFKCGEGDNGVMTRFDFGCQGDEAPEGTGAIQDFVYAIIRFLSIGVGLVLVASIIYAGIMYSSSEGNPEATQAAKKRVQNAVIGLVFYMFIFALVQYLVPGGLFAS